MYKKYSRSAKSETRYFTIYPGVCFALGNYAIDEYIVEKFGIVRFAQPSKMTPSQYTRELKTRTLLCGGRDKMHTLNVIFIKGLAASIPQKVKFSSIFMQRAQNDSGLKSISLIP